MGYIVPVLREKFKTGKIIVLHIEEGFPPSGVPEYFVKDSEVGFSGVQDFLEEQIPQTDSSNIKIIEWRPSLSFYKEDYVNLLSEVVNFIKRRDAEKRTVSAFGKKWIRNFFKNIALLSHALLYRDMSLPVIITGSGPSLEKTLPLIKKAQDGCLIIASSSSVMALSHTGISPDLVITTDGGAWALRHIYPCYRNNTGRTAFAANLCAALPSQCEENPFLVINDGSFWQSVILHELSIPSVIIPQKGTVTASAVELALTLTSANIYLAGMDLSVKDIRTHTRPYAFDHLQFDAASRLTPVYSQAFVRSALLREGGSLDIYAEWFKKQLASWPKRIFYLDENFSRKHGTVKNLPDYFKTVDVKNAADNLRGKGIQALLSALKDEKYAGNIKAELMPMLFPGETDVPDMELMKKMTDITS
jgi:hypothetical protein